MSKYFDKQKWLQEIRCDDWYLRLYEDFQRLMGETENRTDERSREIREEVYQFFEEHLESGDIALGQNGPDEDEERKPIDTIVIHHTKRTPGITWQRLNAMHLIRLYAPQYITRYRREGTREAIFSHHFRDGQQVFYAYHWLMRMDGSLERLLNDKEVGWQAGNWDINCRSIAICLDNNFEDFAPSDLVISAVANLIRKNYLQIRVENIVGHREVNPKTTCPGNQFLDVWKAKLLASIHKS